MAKQSLIIFLKSLEVNSYFNIITFGSHFKSMFESSKKLSEKILNETITKVEVMKANMGGTEIYNPLSFIFES